MSAPGVQPAELGFFVALATAGSLSAAARNLGITTPAVSKRLAQMEARIGMPLVTRTTRRMSLTPEGEVLLERARRILGEIDDLDQLLTQAKGRPSGRDTVAATALRSANPREVRVSASFLAMREQVLDLIEREHEVSHETC